MQNRSVFSTVLLLALLAICVLSVSASASRPRVPRQSRVLPRPQTTINPSEIDNLLAIAQTWPFIQPFWTREALSTACAIPAPVRGIVSCNNDGFVTELDIQVNGSSKSVPLLESFETLTSLENFTSTLPFAQQLPRTWSKLTQLRSISMTRTQIPGGVIPEEWKTMTLLRHFELEFLTTFDVFEIPAGNIPGWFGTLFTLKLTNVNFGRHASLEGRLQPIQVLNLTNVGWDYNLEAIHDLNAIRLKSLSIMAPWSFARGPGPDKPLNLGWVTSMFLSVIELSNLPSINRFPDLPWSIRNVTLRNLPNLAGSVDLSQLWTGNSGTKFLEISFCPLLTGPIPFPPEPSQSSVESIIINNVGFTGNIPAEVFSAPNLKTFSLNNLPNLAKLAWPKEPSYCNITALTLTSLKITGSIPSYIAETCKKLEKLDLSFNAMSGAILNKWKSQTFKHFALDSNRFLGSVPTTLTFKTQSPADNIAPANWFSVHGNFLDGTIPASYFNGRFSVFNVAENSIRLCGNAGEITNSTHQALQNAMCYISPQSKASSVCECASAWPSQCLPPGAC